jgi:hypothetical protein
MERTLKTVHFPGYLYGDNAVPPVPSSFRNVPLRAERIGQLNNRMRRKRVGLLAFHILASLRAVRHKQYALYCLLRADQTSSDIWCCGRIPNGPPNELNSVRHSHCIVQRYIFEVICVLF